jgi:hypothetical protein
MDLEYKKNIYVFLSGLAIFTLQFETLPLPVKVQILPLTSILIFFYVFFIYEKLTLTPSLLAFVTFFLFASIHSFIALNIDMFGKLGEPIRFIAWFRQYIALVSAFLIFFTLRCFLRYVDISWIAQKVIIFSMLSVTLGFLNFIWGYLNIEIVGEVVRAIRGFVAPYGYVSATRSSGLSLEPSHFAAYIVIVILPFLIVYRGLLKPLILLIIGISFLWTFSATGLILLFLFSVFGIIFGFKRKHMFALVLIGFILFILNFIIFTNTQIARHLSTLFTGSLSISIIDRFYSTFGPFLKFFSSLNIVGYGLGASSFYLSEIIPKDLYFQIITVRWKELPSLGTLIGRVFVETGLIGLILFFLIFLSGYIQINKLIKYENVETLKTYYKSFKLGFLLSFISFFFVFGSFHLPYFWFWLALIDSLYINKFATYEL